MRRPGTVRRAGTRQVVLLTAALGLLALAGFFLLTSGGSDAPTDEYLDFVCEKCGHEYSLSHREFEQVWERGDFTKSPEDNLLRFRCPECGELATRRKGREDTRSGTP
jgi:predicted RNA-binding Zn-ribbon protein involved in translation (DUF1610 family)